MPEYTFSIPFPNLIQNAYNRHGRELVPVINDTLNDLAKSWELGVKSLGIAASTADGLINTLTSKAPDHNIQHLIAVADYAARIAVQSPIIRTAQNRRSVTDAIMIGSFLHDGAQQQAASQDLESGDNPKHMHAEIGSVLVANLLVDHQQELGIDDETIGLAVAATYFHTSARQTQEYNGDGQYKAPNLRVVCEELEAIRVKRPYLNRALPEDLSRLANLRSYPLRNLRMAVAQTVFWADEMTALLPSDQALIRTVTTYPNRPLMSSQMELESLDPNGDCDTDFGRILHEVKIQSSYMKMAPPAVIAPWLKEVVEARVGETDRILRTLRAGELSIVHELETKVLNDLSSRLPDSEAYEALGPIVDSMEYVRQVLTGKIDSIRVLDDSDFERQLRLLSRVYENNTIRAVSSNGQLAKALRKPAPYRKVTMKF